MRKDQLDWIAHRRDEEAEEFIIHLSKSRIEAYTIVTYNRAEYILDIISNK